MQGSDSHSYADLSQGTINHVDLHIKVDFHSRTLRIRAQYNMKEPAVGALHLDSRGLSIGHISSKTSPVEFEVGASDAILGERVSMKLRDPTDSFTIDLTTAPDAKALQWLDPKKTEGGRQPFLYSQCYAIQARSIFPCQDRPSVRFTYDAQLEVPRGMTAVMAAQHVGTQRREHTDIYSFRMSSSVVEVLKSSVEEVP
jgi:aminopeptidase N